MGALQQALLEILFENKNGYISGQTISNQLGCSRTAVWKHIKDLENKGYHIESIHKKGYKLISAPNELSEGEILAGLKTEKLGKKIIFKEKIPSTQKLAHHLAEDGTPHGSLVLADQQLTGRGRLGRQWHSPKGTGIWMSLIIRPELSPQRAPQLTLLTAVAIVKAIQDVTQVECQIKWPNDILYQGKKLVGILTELQAEVDVTKAVIIGIGMNVNIDKNQFPDDLVDKATSIKEITGKEFRRSTIIQTILFEFEKLYNIYLQEGFSIIKLLWESYAVSIGQVIKVRLPRGNELLGKAKGINEEGVLLLEGNDGEIHHIYSADIIL